jgi:hypothetical protein
MKRGYSNEESVMDPLREVREATMTSRLAPFELTGQSVSIPAHWGTSLEAGLDPVLPRVWAQREFSAVIRLTEVQSGGHGPASSNIDGMNVSRR